MELKDFIATTLVGIIEGVVGAQERVKELKAHINPGGLMRSTDALSDDAVWDNRHNNYARLVSFDVGLSVEESSTAGGKIGVATGFFNVGAGGGTDAKHTAVNSVQFAVPVLFPVSELPPEARMPKKPTMR